MKFCRSLLCTSLLLALSLPSIFGYKEITSILERATDLKPEERNALRPLFDDLQAQYDYISGEVAQDGEAAGDDFVANLYETTRHEFEQYFVGLLEQKHGNNNNMYDTRLPTVVDLIGDPRGDLTPAELHEYDDIEGLLQDTLSEAQTHISAIVERAQQLESQLIKIDKHKIVEYIYNALSVLFQMSVRVSRAAYCTYSQIPQLNESLHNIYEGVDCYTYTTGLVLRIQHETVQTVGTIKRNVFDLAAIYKKVAAKHSILGKLAALLLNITKITRDIRESYAMGMQSLDRLQNELPDAAVESLNCGLDFVAGIPQMIETASNVSTCILFVDNTTNDYDFMKPAPESEFNANGARNKLDEFDDELKGHYVSRCMILPKFDPKLIELFLFMLRTVYFIKQ